MSKRPKPQRRKFRRADHRRTIPLKFGLPGRLFRLNVCQGTPFAVELRVSRTRRLMHNEIQRISGSGDLPDRRTEGQCSSWHTNYTRVERPVLRSRFLVAVIFVNAQDLRRNAAEVLAHECTHAGMAWARYRRANLAVMADEEILAHAVGHLHWQACHAMVLAGVW